MSILKPSDDIDRLFRTTTQISRKKYLMSGPTQHCSSCSLTCQRCLSARTKNRRTAINRRSFSRVHRSNYCVWIRLTMKVLPSRLSSQSRFLMLKSKSTRSESRSTSSWEKVMTSSNLQRLSCCQSLPLKDRRISLYAIIVRNCMRWGSFREEISTRNTWKGRKSIETPTQVFTREAVTCGTMILCLLSGEPPRQRALTCRSSMLHPRYLFWMMWFVLTQPLWHVMKINEWRKTSKATICRTIKFSPCLKALHLN